ncbi:serine hydrolase domain-containing protein [Actinophytocola sp.]|uniref:serine hydrolase domain-containing protein n=1 Tax=Actinophytocola sp. TaxID=1872138 RepID=UPI002ED3D227
MISDRLASALDTFIPDAIRVTRTPGLTFAIADSSGLAYSRAFGMADLGTPTVMRRDHVIRAGSISKLVVAAAVLQLHDRGHLRIDAPISDYTDLVATNPRDQTRVTAYHLLTHTSGLRWDTNDASLTAPLPLHEHLQQGLRSPRGREYGGRGARWTAPTGQFQYSNFGFGMLGQLVATTNPDGLSFSDYVAREIFGPLALRSTSIPAPTAPGEDESCRATGYGVFGSWGVPCPPIHSAVYPGAGLLTTAEDCVKFLAALFLPDHSHYGALVQPSSILTMVNQHVTTLVEDQVYGFGLGVAMGDLDSPNAWIGIGGQYPFGWCSFARVYPHHGVAVVAMSNAFDMARWFQPPSRTAAGLSAEFVARWLSGEIYDRPGSWSSRSAYAAGLLFGDRICGLLNADGPLRHDTIVAMAAGARPLHADRTTWDAEAFARGAATATAAAPDPVAIRTLVDLQTGRLDLDLQALAWGASTAAFPAPMPFWADAQGEQDHHLPHLDLYGGEVRGGTAV